MDLGSRIYQKMYKFKISTGYNSGHLHHICGSFIQYPDSQQVPDQLLQENLNKIGKLLIKFFKDEHTCFHCLSTHSSFQEVEDMGKKVQYQVAKETAYKKTRNVYNILAFLNIIMVFMIFGGPLLISIISIINSLFMCLSKFFWLIQS
jgi:hypothetical protein